MKKIKIKNSGIRKKKVVFIIDALSGGAGRVVYDLAVNIDKERFEPVVIAIYPGGSVVELFEGSGIKIIDLNKGPGIGFKTISRIRKILIKEKADIVHTHNVDAYEYGIIAAKLAGVKKIIHTAHGKSVKRGRVKRLRENLYHKIVSLFLNNYIVVSNDLGIYAANNWCANWFKVKVIYNGIDHDKYKPKKVSRGFLKRYGVLKDDLLAGVVAGLRAVKNHKMLIRAMNIVCREVPNAKLLVVGCGPEMKKLKELTAELGLDNNVFFLGHRYDIDRIMNCIDVNVLSSFSECLSITLLEAMACELPCVATSVGGNPELIKENTGFLVSSKDHAAMAEKISLLFKDKNLRQKMGAEARESVIKNFSIDKMVEVYEKLYI